MLKWDMAIDMLIELRNSKMLDYEYKVAIDTVLEVVKHIPNKKLSTLYVDIQPRIMGMTFEEFMLAVAEAPELREALGNLQKSM